MKQLVLGILLALPVMQTATPAAPARGETKMTEAKGSFEVKMSPVPEGPAEGLSRFTFTKTFHGDIEGTSQGEMMSGGDAGSGNAGYVAIERITGKLGSPAGARTGSFAVMQQGSMIKGSAPQMTGTIVPGSGTGDLSGIYGSMNITMPGGKHAYEVFYAFAQ